MGQVVNNRVVVFISLLFARLCGARIVFWHEAIRGRFQCSIWTYLQHYGIRVFLICVGSGCCRYGLRWMHINWAGSFWSVLSFGSWKCWILFQFASRVFREMWLKFVFVRGTGGRTQRFIVIFPALQKSQFLIVEIHSLFVCLNFTFWIWLFSNSQFPSQPDSFAFFWFVVSVSWFQGQRNCSFCHGRNRVFFRRKDPLPPVGTQDLVCLQGEKLVFAAGQIVLCSHRCLVLSAMLGISFLCNHQMRLVGNFHVYLNIPRPYCWDSIGLVFL